MNRKHTANMNGFSHGELMQMFARPNHSGAVRMLSINPNLGVKMTYELDPELEEIFGDDEEIIFSLDCDRIYLSCASSSLIHVGKRVYLRGTGVAYKLDRNDDYADMSTEEMADACLELFDRMQRVRLSDFCSPVIDLTDDEESSHEEEK